MHNAEERPDFAEINQELQSKVSCYRCAVIINS